ncbi:hypothetical protein BCR32DRAFT_285517 [Anaeromyces robustus]|uniref:Uncharacterized protein n=1 Tax=Anaeromyces robustus TaxID=1754192 RepID=A0A1Y1WNV5_9FUNG|nr:hypothetical protein BCR32DRAFT_285517 [Anaeromyces robustus]|eukprot:ORX75065.1 hypothetical protein BCR32DRAFT_285517 [Anaeromyces robustus]
MIVGAVYGSVFGNMAAVDSDGYDVLPIIIKDSESKILIEHKPRVQYGVIYYTSSEIIEGET